MEVAVPVAGRMIVLGTVSALRNVTSAAAISSPRTELVDSNFRSQETSHHPGISLNRKLAVAIAVPLCFLFLLAVLGIVLYCTRRRRPLRSGTGSRRRSSPETHRNNFVEPLNTSPVEPSPEEQTDWGRPPTAISRSDDGLSRITEMPSISDGSLDRRTSHGLPRFPTSPLVLPPELPSPISSHSETVNPRDNSSEDFAGHFSGLDEDPFSDSAAASIPKEASPEISPSARPVQSRPQIDTASSIGAATSGSSDHPVTAINTGGTNSVSDEPLDGPSDRVVSRAMSRASGADPSPIEYDTGILPENVGGLPPAEADSSEAGQPAPELSSSPSLHDVRRDRLDPRTIPVNSGRSSSVSAKELRQHAAAIEQQDLKSSRSADDILPEDHFLDAFVSPSSSEYPAPPLSDRRSWLEDVTGEQGGNTDVTLPSADTKQNPQPKYCED